jgi:hypothetical protein
MKDSQDYIKEIGAEIQELLQSGNNLEESATAVLTKHTATLEEKVNQLCVIRGMPTKACGTDALVRGRKEVEQKCQQTSEAVIDSFNIGVHAACEWFLFKRDSI